MTNSKWIHLIESDEKDVDVYHVTYYKNLDNISKQGLKINSPSSIGRGGSYDSHSRDKIFLTELSGVPFWHERAEDHAHDRSDDVHKEKLLPVVLKITDPAWEEIEADPVGNRDSTRGEAYMTKTSIPPSKILVWTSKAWTSVKNYKQVVYDEGFEDPDDEGLIYFKSYANKLVPK